MGKKIFIVHQAPENYHSKQVKVYKQKSTSHKCVKTSSSFSVMQFLCIKRNLSEVSCLVKNCFQHTLAATFLFCALPLRAISQNGSIQKSGKFLLDLRFGNLKKPK